jgi:CDP-diacylglycerol--serine O-phosphatidyltransferase
MIIARQIPNTLTLINLLLGTMGVIAMDNGFVETALILMGICLVADILDGAIARMMKISSPLGVQLDSLADIISFGVLPTMMLFYLGSRFWDGSPGQIGIAVLASLNAASAGLRLARFNVDERPREYFWGLATPSGAMLVAGWLWAQHIDRDYGFGVAERPWGLVIIILFLVVAYQVPLRLPGLKSPKNGLIIATVIGIAVVAGLFILGPISIPAGIMLYFFTGVLNLLFKWY